MLSGRRPFSGETNTDVIVSVLSSEPPPMSSYGRDTPAELEWVVSKALTKDAAGRYQTATELRVDLEKIKKQIEVDESVNRSASRNPKEKEKVLTIAAQAHPTSNDADKRTDEGLDGAADPRAFRSAPSASGYLRSVRTRRVPYAILALALLAVVSPVVYFGFICFAHLSKPSLLRTSRWSMK
jgi:serine/threonine protein kinase